MKRRTFLVTPALLGGRRILNARPEVLDRRAVQETDSLDSVWRFSAAGPLPRWLDGFPVGNGRIGAQSWGAGPELFLTLDRSDVWDLRYEPNRKPQFNYARLRELVRNRQHALIQEEMTPDVSPTADFTPFHLPAGRVRIELPDKTTVRRVDFDMQHAEVSWDLRMNDEPAAFSVFACATHNVLAAVVQGFKGWEPRIRVETLSELVPALVGKLGYEKPIGGSEGKYTWVLQPIPESGSLAVVWRIDAERDQWET